MKTFIAVALAFFATIAPAFAQEDFVLHFLNESGGTYSVQMDLQPQGAKRNIRIWMFSNGEKEDSVALDRDVDYPLLANSWNKDGRTSKTYIYSAQAGVSQDTLSLLPEAGMSAVYGEVKEVIYNAEAPAPEEASASDYLPAEDPVLEATSPDSLLGPEITPARVPAKYKKPVPKALFDKEPWELASWDNLSVAEQDAILLAHDKCLLTVINQTADIFKFRVGHLWWEEQNGLLPDQSGILYIATDEHHELHRYMWENGTLHGIEREDMYSFYIPRGVARHSITFGGPQTGRIVNQSGEAIKVATPMMAQSVLIPEGDYRDKVQSLPGRQLFIVYFGPDWHRYREIYFHIDDNPADNPVQIVEEIGGQRLVRTRRVDFIATVTPGDLRAASYLPHY